MQRKLWQRLTRGSGSAASLIALAAVMPTGAVAGDMPNACPREGCSVRILAVEPAGDELSITFEANFTPDVSKNHFHVWWGDRFDVEQVGRGAGPEHGVTQGEWHRHDDYPVYVTREAASTSLREGTTTLCVSAADRNHHVIDVETYDCVDAADHLKDASS
ncbi:MAG: hypothetical protein AAFX81_09980 [Pseudomonadota bacterium]